MGIYVTNKEGETLSFNYSYKQTFYHDVKGNRGLPEYAVITAYMNEPEHIRQAILEILIFIKKFEFVSVKQLRTMLEGKGIANVDLDLVLEKCVEAYLLNYFIISQYDMGETPDDAFRVYCLDTRALFILSHFSTVDTISWFSTDNLRCIELVTKYLATAEFYQQLQKYPKYELSNFAPLFNANIGKRMIRYSAAFTVMHGYTPLNYIFEVVRSYDLPGPWQKKVSEQVAVFDTERCWRKYYDTKPYYLFLAEDVEQGREVAEIFHRITGNDAFQIITDDVFSKGLQDSPIYTYDLDSRKLVA